MMDLLLDERGNTWLMNEAGTTHAAWFKLDDGCFLEVTVEPDNYPGFYVRLTKKSETEIAAHINANLQGWFIRKCHLSGVQQTNNQIAEE